MTALLSKLPCDYPQPTDAREIIGYGLGIPYEQSTEKDACPFSKNTLVNSFSAYRDRSDFATELRPIPTIAAGGFYGYRTQTRHAAEPQDPIEALTLLAKVIATMPDTSRLIEQAVLAQKAINPALDAHATAFAKVVSLMKKIAPVSLASFTVGPADKWKARLEKFRYLNQGWDSYDAEAPTELSLAPARDFLDHLCKMERMPDQLDPAVVGGVGFTFRNGKRSVYIEFRNTGNAHAAFMGGLPRPQVVKVRQDSAGYAAVMAQVEKHLYEQSARRNEA